jgi:hypothetical protein
MKTVRFKILEEGKFPGMSNRQLPEGKWSPNDDLWAAASSSDGVTMP